MAAARRSDLIAILGGGKECDVGEGYATRWKRKEEREERKPDLAVSMAMRNAQERMR
jgi:hypothetical protein